MGGTLATIQNTADGTRENIAFILAMVTNMIDDFRHDVSGTMVNVANESLESLRRITHQADHTAFLIKKYPCQYFRDLSKEVFYQKIQLLILCYPVR
jgi:hypothetical protein